MQFLSLPLFLQDRSLLGLPKDETGIEQAPHVVRNVIRWLDDTTLSRRLIPTRSTLTSKRLFPRESYVMYIILLQRLIKVVAERTNGVVFRVSIDAFTCAKAALKIYFFRPTPSQTNDCTQHLVSTEGAQYRHPC